MLAKGSLPPSLERQRLSCRLQPLEVGLLPSQLKLLHLGVCPPLQPRILPSSLLFLSLDGNNNPLLPDALPSSRVELRLCGDYCRPLLPGVLPSSLRRRTLGSKFRENLQAGSLPERLLFIRYLPRPSFVQSQNLPGLQPGVLPSTLLGINFTDRYKADIPAGIIPPSVRWLRLPSRRFEAQVRIRSSPKPGGTAGFNQALAVTLPAAGDVSCW